MVRMINLAWKMDINVLMSWFEGIIAASHVAHRVIILIVSVNLLFHCNHLGWLEGFGGLAGLSQTRFLEHFSFRAIGTWRRLRRVLLIGAFTSPPRKLIPSFNKLLMPQEFYSTKFRFVTLPAFISNKIHLLRKIFLLNCEFGLTQAKFPIKLAKRAQSRCFIEETNLARKNSDTIW